MADDLTTRIAALAKAARPSATSPEAASSLTEVVERLEGPIRLAISGKVKAGKSTLLNALIGENLAPTDAGECTRIVTWYRFSARPFALIHPVDGEPQETSYARGENSLDVDLEGLDAEGEKARVELADFLTQLNRQASRFEERRAEAQARVAAQ